MSLSAGARVGAYEILAKIGEGGMGEVYRAKDTKLGRAVALKFLPDVFAKDTERLARFKREAYVLASLNHTNIAAIYGIEESDGGTFLVMELVDGDDLSQRIQRGALPLEEGLPIAKQIVEALESAHEQGIIHRDLKPANIKVRADGTVKILDFGLAKALERSPDASARFELTHSPTITSPAQMTSVGVILGTAAYMAPEQAKGRAVDKRADVWAFGTVLYEMLTGRRCFPGDDLSDTFAAILRADPDWKAVPAATPAAIKRLLHRCLEKDARWRLPDMAAARIELRDAELKPDEGPAAPANLATVQQSATKRFAPYAASVLVALATGAAVWRVREPTETLKPLTRFSIDASDQPQLLGAARNPVAISPDGTHIVYGWGPRLFLRAMDQVAATSLAATETTNSGAFNPFFSPDGQWIGYWQDAQLKKVAVAGGAPVAICSGVPDIPLGISWEQNEILWDSPQGIMRVPSTGGTPELLFANKDPERFGTPQMLPGTEWLLLIHCDKCGAGDQNEAVVQSRKTGERRVLIQGLRLARYVPSGHLVYSRGQALLAQAFDVRHLTLSGTAVPVVDGVANAAAASPSVFAAISSSGTLAYVQAIATGATSTKLVQVSRDGSKSPLTDVAGMAWFPRYSPDGTRVAFGISPTTILNEPSDLWVLDLARGARTRITFKENNRFYPIWTRDGERLTFADSTNPTNRVLTAPSDGSGGTQVLLDVGTRRYPTSWSPDGKTLALYAGGQSSAGGAGSNRDIVMLRTDDEKHALTPFVATPFEERGAIFSPNGRWVAYVSNKSGQNDVFAKPYPDPGNEVTISVGGGQEPVWGPSGRELFYRHENKLMVVKIDETPTSLQVGAPATLFEDTFRRDTGGAAGGMANYDISPDGKRFVMVEEPRAATDTRQPVRLQIVLNWFDELKRRVPTN